MPIPLDPFVVMAIGVILDPIPNGGPDILYRISVSRRAARTMLNHAAFLARVNPGAAEKLASEFEKTIDSLETMPRRCPLLYGEFIPQNVYRFILLGQHYMVIFRVVDDVASVDYVVDCRQDYYWLIR